MAAWTVNDHIEKQFEAFKKGFLRVVTGDMIKVNTLLFSYFLQKSYKKSSVDQIL